MEEADSFENSPWFVQYLFLMSVEQLGKTNEHTKYIVNNIVRIECNEYCFRMYFNIQANSISANWFTKIMHFAYTYAYAYAYAHQCFQIIIWCFVLTCSGLWESELSKRQPNWRWGAIQTFNFRERQQYQYNMISV